MLTFRAAWPKEYNNMFVLTKRKINNKIKKKPNNKSVVKNKTKKRTYERNGRGKRQKKEKT